MQFKSFSAPATLWKKAFNFSIIVKVFLPLPRTYLLHIMTDSNNQNQNPSPDSNSSDSESSHHITITIPKNSKVKIIITPNTSPPNRGRGKSGAEKCLTHESKKINVENVEEVNPGPFDHHPSCPMDQD